MTGINEYVSSTNDVLLLSLQLNPTLSAPLTYTSVANSAAEQAKGDGIITVTTAGTILFSEVITSNTVFSPESFLQDFLTVLGISINNVSDQIILCGTPITSSISTYGSINYKEY